MLVVTFQIGEHRIAMDIRQIVQVIPCIPVRPVAFSATWQTGVIIFRGNVIPIVDLALVFGVESCPSRLSTRIILVETDHLGRSMIVGLLAAQVSDVTSMEEIHSKHFKELPTDAGSQPSLGKVILDDVGILNLAHVNQLLSTVMRDQLSRFQEVA